MQKKTALAVLISLCGIGFACSESHDHSHSDQKFISSEHVVLGDRGYLAACENLNFDCPEKLHRADLRRSISYGFGVSYGDFYADPLAAYFETDRPFYVWNRNNVGAVEKLVTKDLTIIEKMLHGHDELEFPSNDVKYLWYYPNFLNLALNNEAHFGFYNMKAYIRHHQLALDIARQAHQISHSDPAKSRLMLEKALFVNAYADHFLTDSFASGHIRNPRKQIKAWAAENGVRVLAGDLLAKIVHDRDGEVRRSGEHGLMVTNSLGQRWFTRCDSQLFWQNSLDDPAVAIPVRAVQASVEEVLITFQTGEQPDGVFAATWYVPFMDDSEQSLIDFFSPRMSPREIDQIISNMEWYARIRLITGFSRNLFLRFVDELPEIMDRFRADIQAGIETHEELLEKRLPPQYLEGFLRIR